MADYRAHLETVTTAEEADEDVKDCRVRLAVVERVGIGMREANGNAGFDGLSALHARLRLAERHAKALAARPVNVSGSGVPKGRGNGKRKGGGK